jgi:hypothetical protein
MPSSSEASRTSWAKRRVIFFYTVDDARPGFKEFYGTQTRVLTSRTLVRRTMDQLDV